MLNVDQFQSSTYHDSSKIPSKLKFTEAQTAMSARSACPWIG